MEGGVDLSKIIIIPLINVEDNATWYPKLISMVPPFDILYSGNELVVTLASPHLEVKTPKFVNKKRYNGSYIRYRILCGQKWSHLVSKSVFDIICRLDGIKRMKRLAKHESLESRKVVDLQ
jgi:nicotinamide-nucleotide adenylyltransferase